MRLEYSRYKIKRERGKKERKMEEIWNEMKNKRKLVLRLDKMECFLFQLSNELLEELS